MYRVERGILRFLVTSASRNDKFNHRIIQYNVYLINFVGGSYTKCGGISPNFAPQNLAEREGFEPSVPPFSSTRDFQSRSFGQLGHLSEILFCPLT